eukprot:350848-Chlamydomonas_euryale.AAC.2
MSRVHMCREQQRGRGSRVERWRGMPNGWRCIGSRGARNRTRTEFKHGPRVACSCPCIAVVLQRPCCCVAVVPQRVCGCIAVVPQRVCCSVAGW